MRIQLISKLEPGISGISRYTQDLYQGLKTAGLDIQLTFPEQLPIPSPLQAGLKRVGFDIQAFFANYPLQVKTGNADIYHLSGQTLATLLWSQSFSKPVVVSVLDIIPYLVRHDPQLNTFRHPFDYLFFRLALAGLRRADALIAISEYTKRTLVEVLHLPEERIQVVYPFVDSQTFHPIDVPDAFRTKYGLDKEQQYVLFVGSHDPRKNLRTLVRAFALLRHQISSTKLLCVGSSQFAQEGRKLLALVAELGLQRDVIFFDHVSDEDLPAFYSAADVFVMPSLYEGFGLPLLEAMACGAPVVFARTGSLPEVAGSSGIQVHPQEVDALADALVTLLVNPDERMRLALAGYEQAAKFTWARSASEIERVYTKLLESWAPSKDEMPRYGRSRIS